MTPTTHHPLATAVRVLAGLACLAVAVLCLASPAGWVYLCGELLLAAGVCLLVAPAFRDRSAS